MFAEYFKSSIKSLPFLLLPVLAFIIFVFVVDARMVEQGSIIVEDGRWLRHEGGEGFFWMRTGMIIAILVNFLLLMVVPAIGRRRLDSGVKQRQFYIGFFVNLALALIIPIFIHASFRFSGLTLVILLGLFLLKFLAPFVAGAMFTAPAYRRAFWFFLKPIKSKTV
jgi:hypothetical protein